MIAYARWTCSVADRAIGAYNSAVCVCGFAAGTAGLAAARCIVVARLTMSPVRGAVRLLTPALQSVGIAGPAVSIAEPAVSVAIVVVSIAMPT